MSTWGFWCEHMGLSQTLFRKCSGICRRELWPATKRAHGNSHGSGGRINPLTPSLLPSTSLLLSPFSSSSLLTPSPPPVHVCNGPGVWCSIAKQCHLGGRHEDGAMSGGGSGSTQDLRPAPHGSDASLMSSSAKGGSYHCYHYICQIYWNVTQSRDINGKSDTSQEL